MSTPTDGFGNVSGGGAVPRPLTLAEITPLVQNVAGDIIRTITTNLASDVRRAIETELNKWSPEDNTSVMDGLEDVIVAINKHNTTLNAIAKVLGGTVMSDGTIWFPSSTIGR